MANDTNNNYIDDNDHDIISSSASCYINHCGRQRSKVSVRVHFYYSHLSMQKHQMLDS